MSGCTAVGLLADVAIIKSIEGKDTPAGKKELPLTEIGLEADIAFIGGLLGNVKVKKEPLKQDDLAPNESVFSGKCPRKLTRGEACYSDDYYAQFRERVNVNSKTSNYSQSADSDKQN